MKKISAYYRIIQNLTCMGFFFTLIFAVKSFENAVPDEIYVRAGETVSYDFDVPVVYFGLITNVIKTYLKTYNLSPRIATWN